VNQQPPTGYYRRLISDKNIRLAFTHTPICNCTKIDATNVVDELRQSSDEFAKYYIDKIEKGEIVAIVEKPTDKVYRNNGELFFTT
jgi:hypothetical protein